MRMALLIAVLAITGCSVSLQKTLPENTVWRMTVTQQASDDTDPFPINLIIARPHVPASLNSDRLALAQTEHQVNVLAGHQWDAPLPTLLQDYWLEYFQTTQRYLAVSDKASASLPNVQLTAYVWHFDTRLTTGSTAMEVRLKLYAYLGWGRDVPTRIVFDEAVALNTHSLGEQGKVAALVDAHNRLLTKVSQQIHQALIARLAVGTLQSSIP